MRGNQQSIEQIKLQLKRTKKLLRNKPRIKQIRVWNSGNTLACATGGQQFASRSGAFFSRSGNWFQFDGKTQDPGSVENL